MSINASVDIKRLEKQIYLHNPSLHRFSEAGKDRIRKKLYNQLQLSQPKVSLEKYHVHKLLVNIEKNFQKCKDFGIIQTSNEAYEDFQKRNQLMDLKAVQLSEQSEDDDDDIVKPEVMAKKSILLSPDQTPPSDCDDNLPLAIRREPRKRIYDRRNDEYEMPHSQSSNASSRKRAYTIFPNEATEHEQQINKNDSVDTQVTLTISLPSILRESTDNNLEISVDFGKIDLARQVLDQRIRRISDNETNVSNSKTKCTPANNQNAQQSQTEKEVSVDDEALSCLISEVLVEPNSVETWRATAALENINNNVGDNYNSNIAVQRRLSVGMEAIPSSTLQVDGIKKKQRKRPIKVNSSTLPKGPPKKRGRKPGQKKAEKKLDCEKSDLARYVELFSNNCELPCPATSTTMSSTMSQMVSSTTQNYEDPQRTANETQTAQISYLINGEWTNGGICQLISSGNVGNIDLDTGHITQEDFSLNTPFEDFVNYIDSSNNDVGNNEIARVLDANNIAPSTCSNLVDVSNILPMNQISLVDNLRKISNSACVANMQKSKKNIPPPAHNIEGGGILDLSLKSELFSSVVIEEEENEASTNNCEPMDLSMKSKYDENQLQSSLQLIQGEEESDDVFLRRLIDNSDFDYKDDNSNNNCNSTEPNDLLFEPILNANVSFKAALDMPLLDNDESALAVNQNSAEIQECDKQQKCLDDFTENFGDNHHIIEPTQNIVRDLNTPPRLTFIQTQESTNLLPIDENNQVLTQDEIKNLVLADIVPVENDNKNSILNKITDDPGTPPTMSLIPKSDYFSNTTQSSTNEEVFKDKTNVVNLTTLDTNKNTNDAKHLINELHPQSLGINSVPNEADKNTDHLIYPHQVQSDTSIDIKSDIDTALSNSVIKVDVTETNIQEVFKNNNSIEDLSSKHNKNDSSNGEANITSYIEANNIVKSHAKDLMNIENEAEDNKDNKQTINIDLRTKIEPTANEFIQNAEQANVDSTDADRTHRVQESEIINKESIQIAEECTKLQTNNYTLPETQPKVLQYTGAENENEATQFDIETSITINNSIEKTFIANVEENIEVECNKHHLLEVQQENLNKSESDKMDFIINDSMDELSHNIVSNNTVERNDTRLLEVILEKNVKKRSPIKENQNKEIENEIIENTGSVQFAETQVASYNLSPTGKIVTEIEDVKSLLSNENEENNIFEKIETSEYKKPKSPSKLQIISVVSIDSFIHTNEDDNEFIRRTLNSHENEQKTVKQDEDCNKTRMNINIPEEKSNIKEEEVAKSIEECKNNTLHESVAVVPEEVKNLFDQVIDIKSETIEAIDTKNTLVNSKTKPTETKALNTSLENTELKTEPNNDTEQSDNPLDVIKEESNIIDLSVSCKNNEIIVTEPPTEDTKSLDLTIEIKPYNSMDETTCLSVQDAYSEENIVNCDMKTTKSEITSEYTSDSCHGDEQQCSTLAQNKPVPMLITEDSSPITICTESNDSNEDLTENYRSDDKQQEVAVEEDNTNTLKTIVPVEQTKEITQLIMTTIPKDVLAHNHNNNLFLSNLSLLEMEEKFDESLDFDNHLEDDVLSLATSCFNSPIDDRFGNSIIVDEPDDADIKPIFVNSTEDDLPPKPEFVEIIVRPQMKEELNDLEEKDLPIDPISTLTKFKIPKLGAAQTKQFIQQTNEAPPTKRIELDKITRTVQNVCAVPPLPLQPSAMCSVANTNMLAQRKHDLFSNPTGNGISCVITLDQKVDCESFAKDVLVHNNPNYMHISRGQFAGRGGEAINSGAAILDIAKIFGPTCLPFLVDKCSVLGNGQHSHQLRDTAFVQMALEGLPKADLNTAYKFMFNHSKLFRRYFFVFCSVYSKHNNRSKLLNMVYDCEKQTGCVPLLRNIFYSLIECGLNKINACRQILSRSRDKSPATIDVLVGIIFEADWGMFCDYLERFAQMPHYSFRINSLSEMAARVLRTKDTRLSSVVCKCLLTLNQDDYKLVNRTPNLIALLKLMKDGKVC